MGNKSLRSGIFSMIFSIFTLSLLQVLFQSSSTKNVVWGLIYFYFIFMYCTGIKHFEFYIGYKKAKVSSCESALKIIKDFMWDCLRSFYLLFLTVFKYLLSVWNAFGCHSLKSVVETSKAAERTPQAVTWGKKHIDFEISKASIIPVLSTYVWQEVSIWPREAVSHLLLRGETISYHADFPRQTSFKGRSKRWL